MCSLIQSIILTSTANARTSHPPSPNPILPPVQILLPPNPAPTPSNLTTSNLQPPYYQAQPPHHLAQPSLSPAQAPPITPIPMLLPHDWKPSVYPSPSTMPSSPEPPLVVCNYFSATRILSQGLYA